MNLSVGNPEATIEAKTAEGPGIDSILELMKAEMEHKEFMELVEEEVKIQIKQAKKMLKEKIKD
jgi:hypothetical protein